MANVVGVENGQFFEHAAVEGGRPADSSHRFAGIKIQPDQQFVDQADLADNAPLGSRQSGGKIDGNPHFNHALPRQLDQFLTDQKETS